MFDIIQERALKSIFSSKGELINDCQIPDIDEALFHLSPQSLVYIW